MEHRHMNGRKNLDSIGYRQQRAGPRRSLQRKSAEVGLAAETAPFSEREKKIKAGVFRRDRDRLVRRVSPIVGHRLVRTERIKVAAVRHEQTQLQGLLLPVR